MAVELAIAVLLALTLLWLALVVVLGVAFWLVLFKALLGVPTLPPPLESCLGQTCRPMNVADAAVLCVTPLVVEAFGAGPFSPPLAAFIDSMMTDDLTSSVSFCGSSFLENHGFAGRGTYQVTLKYVPECTCVPFCGDVKMLTLTSVAASATERSSERMADTDIMSGVRWRVKVVDKERRWW